MRQYSEHDLEPWRHLPVLGRALGKGIWRPDALAYCVTAADHFFAALAARIKHAAPADQVEGRLEYLKVEVVSFCKAVVEHYAGSEHLLTAAVVERLNPALDARIRAIPGKPDQPTTLKRTAAELIEAYKRRNANMPDDVLAARAKMARNTLRKIRNGDPCQYESYQFLAAEIGCDASDLTP